MNATDAAQSSTNAAQGRAYDAIVIGAGVTVAFSSWTSGSTSLPGSHRAIMSQHVA
jgi:hypothetical protein